MIWRRHRQDRVDSQLLTSDECFVIAASIGSALVLQKRTAQSDGSTCRRPPRIGVQVVN